VGTEDPIETTNRYFERQLGLEGNTAGSVGAMSGTDLGDRTDVVRASQLDAANLSDDVVDIFAGQIRNILKFHGGGESFLYHYGPEVEAFFRLFIYRSTIYRDVATPGAALQNLIYKSVERPPFLIGIKFIRKLLDDIKRTSTGAGVLAPSSMLDSLRSAAPGAATAMLSTATRLLSQLRSLSATSLLSGPSTAVAAIQTSLQSLKALIVGYLLYLRTTLTNASNEAAESSRMYMQKHDTLLRSESIHSPSFPASNSTAPPIGADLKEPFRPLLRPSQKFLYFIIHILLRWGWVRLGSTLQNLSHNVNPLEHRRFHMVVLRALAWYQKAELAFRWLEFANFVVFLTQGKYLSIADRVLGIRLQYPHPNARRAIALDLLHQQLLWQGILDFILFLMPLIDVRMITSFFKRIFFLGGQGPDNWVSSVGTNTGAGANHLDESMSFATRQSYLQTSCAICNAQPIVCPHKAPCGHIFCYYCLYSRRLAHEAGAFPCPECLEPISSHVPVK